MFFSIGYIFINSILIFRTLFWKIIQIIQIFHQLLISFTIVLFIVYQPVNNNQIGNELKRTHIDFTADESWQKYVFWFAKIWHSLIKSMHSHS